MSGGLKIKQLFFVFAALILPKDITQRMVQGRGLGQWTAEVLPATHFMRLNKQIQ